MHVMMPEQLYQAKLHLLELCRGSVLCYHSSTTNWTLEVYCARVWYGSPGVSAPYDGCTGLKMATDFFLLQPSVLHAVSAIISSNQNAWLELV